MNKIRINLHLKNHEIYKDQFQNRNKCSKSAIETPQEDVICSKLTISIVE